jgi:polysaccharide pyruvyl transferase WcaK-like protein
MKAGGLDVTCDRVFPDLVLGLPVPDHGAGDAGTVGVGVMAYFGGNDDRGRAAELHDAYVDSMVDFVVWLIDSGHRVRLFWGDNKENIDDVVVAAIVQGVCPDVVSNKTLVADKFDTPAQLLEELSQVGTFVGARYHNIASALRMSRPTISIGYSAKHHEMMASMGLGNFCQAAATLDDDLLKKQFLDLEHRRVELRETLIERNAQMDRDLQEQFEILSRLLFESEVSEPALATNW